MEEDQRLLERILDGAEEPRDLPFALLKEITNDFSKERKIGQGGFGEVYKGMLGERIVAVKRIHINAHTFDDKLYDREVTCLLNSNHRNVIQFLGFCSGGYQKLIEKDGSGQYVRAKVLERLLCFRYIGKGSLDRHITDELRGLEWERRYEIIIGICKGLRYLHEEKKIIHMDLKPANILLDQDEKYMVPKITDFGLSRSKKNSHTVGQRYGTLEYMAPEYRDESQTSQSCDIYSLGLIIIELVTGCKDVPDNDNVLRRWRHRWKKPPTQLQYQQVTRYIDIAERCRKKNPEHRPTISWIINFLRESESTYWQMNPSLDKDDMLRIDPLELRLPSEFENEISSSVELTNDTPSCIFAFNIQLPSASYNAQPDKGIVRPESKYIVKITVQAREVCERDNADKFVVQSMLVGESEGLKDEDISKHMFEKTGRFVDEVDLMVVYEFRKPEENFKRSEDTNTPAEEVPESNNCKSSPGSSGKAEAASVVSLAAERRKIASPTVDKGSAWQDATENDQVHYGDQGRGMVTRDIRHNTLLISNEINQEVVTGAMSTLLPMLGDMLTEKYNLQKKTRGEIKFLKAELESMEVALIKVSEAPLDQPPDIQVKLWARDVKDLSYEIEDNIDEFLVCLECQKQKKPHTFMGFVNRSMDMLTTGRFEHKIGVDIKDIRSRINEISERRHRYKVECVVPKPSGKSTDTLRQLAFFQKATQLIGTKEKSLDIVRMLKDGDENQLKMVSIVGFGGIGKTTLANVVYEKLRVDFDCGAIVVVSLKPNMEKVFKSLLRELDKRKYHNIMGESGWSEYDLKREIRNFLQKKRYLILIDDIWDKSMWENITSALIQNECGSRVITTTRILDVAKEVGIFYQLKPLSSNDSRRLFNQRIFGSCEKCPPPQLADVSEKILRKCGGIPLAIITLASMLAGRKGHENTYTYWSKVYQSIGSGLANNPDLKDMRRILYVSYHDLPPNLKACLLYLSSYPEDYKIKTKQLIWKWIGEGFVHEEQGNSLYEIGEAYFRELVNKSLIQPMDINVDNKASSCRVHDIVLDLITSLSNEENFLTTLGGQQPRSVPSKARRLSMQTSKEEDANKMPTIRNSIVRSLTVFSMDDSFSFLLALSGFPVLRTLDLRGCSGVDNHHMKDICNLLHLRYLSLQGTSITDIPKEMAKLRFLQVLDIRTYSIRKLPSTFVQLRKLVFIEMGDRPVSTPLLRLMSFLPLLCSLEIRLELSQENLDALGSMPSLRDLNIDVHNTDKDRDKRLVINFVASTFRSLTRLYIHGRFINFVFAQGTLQMLQSLKVEYDARTTEINCWHRVGLENLSSLEDVYVGAYGVGHGLLEAIRILLQEVLDINPNNPTLTVQVWMRQYQAIRPDANTAATIAHHISGRGPGELSIQE